MKIKLLTAVCCIALLSAGNAWAFTVKTTSKGTMVQWPDEDTAIFYVVSSLGPGSQSGTVGALAQAFRGWEEKSRGNIKFIFSGQSSEKKARKDGTNTLIWIGEEWKYEPEVVAVSATWYSDETGLMEEVDIEFNTRDYNWSLDGSEDTLGVREVAMHEIGHLLGIGHSFDPGSVMSDSISSQRPVRRALSKDDIEALWFLYPQADVNLKLYDLPVLIYPGDFPEEEAFLSLSGPKHGADRWVTALGTVDADGDGYRSEMITACLDQRGKYSLEIRTFPPDAEGRLTRLSPPRVISRPGEVTAVSGIDLDRDGICGEAAVLIREGEKETLYFYDVIPDPEGPDHHLASLVLKAPPANNVIGLAPLDADGDGFQDEIIILRAVKSGFSLSLYSSPPLWENKKEPQSGLEISFPRFQDGSRLLGLAALDADGDGEERDLVVLEKTASGQYWLYVFRLVITEGKNSYDIHYLTSAPAPEAKGKILPVQMAGVDSNRDGFFNELIIFSSKK